ncbi:DNA-processing protein DprA [Zunongwangia endophytica]|uniref:DNA-processing protein DprA n=1 Tax=Zunongwangia endophytica TaxID=1808945 RepID=A0ABV8H737_9FLAO|nr:DNA-processing protein DprA [Zunongwangia endophytica]MDN3595867.1 DNA-processing protein DprA [Zunongwangia endophytica]
MNFNDLKYVLALQKAPNLGDRTAKKLIARLGSARAIFEEKRQNLLKIEGIGALKLKGLLDPTNFEAAESELEFIQDEQLKTHYFLEDNYPEKLKYCHDAPILMFSKGKIQLENHRIISIVGTRKITSAGKSFVEQFIEELSPLNPIIVSGFAYGVDIAAHRAAVANNLQTIGCLAHGFNQIYPKVHAKYVDSVLENGGFFSDFWSTDNFGRNNFLKRNRIIAGLSEATVVIESAEKGGSLVTADIANSYNREVFAVPGRPGDKYSKGCNELIKSNNAHLLSSAADLVYMLGWKLQEEIKPVQQQLFVDLDSEEQQIYDHLKEKGKSQLDTIALYCNFPTFKTASILLNMELKGVIRPLPGKLFEAI